MNSFCLFRPLQTYQNNNTVFLNHQIPQSAVVNFLGGGHRSGSKLNDSFYLKCVFLSPWKDSHVTFTEHIQVQHLNDTGLPGTIFSLFESFAGFKESRERF